MDNKLDKSLELLCRFDGTQVQFKLVRLNGIIYDIYSNPFMILKAPGTLRTYYTLP